MLSGTISEHQHIERSTGPTRHNPSSASILPVPEKTLKEIRPQFVLDHPAHWLSEITAVHGLRPSGLCVCFACQSTTAVVSAPTRPAYPKNPRKSLCAKAFGSAGSEPGTLTGSLN